MSLKFFHDSHLISYRCPLGAAPAGSILTICLKVQGDTAVGTKVSLRLWQDDKGARLLEMAPASWEDDIYTVTFTLPQEGCLLWYYFKIRQGENLWYYGNNRYQKGGCGTTYTKEPPSYQITVYDGESKTPSWFKKAVAYQIFPDRFCREESGTVHLEGKHGAVLHSCWDDLPFYCKDRAGNVVQYDFFGGNLAGIRSKFAYLQDLGITTLYLNPVFASRSNHRYDTSDYKKIDSFLGTNEEFASLCREARARGIRIILDGVFSHTGDDSRYFNKYGTYPDLGAYQSQASLYYEWYRFNKYPDDYKSWWGVKVLPEVEETTPSYMDFIIRSEDSILNYWLKQGISGWRLDVADELPLPFLEQFYKTLKVKDTEAVLLGEVWEDASNKISYGQQRSYLCGHKLDGVMNYVLRQLMLDFVLGHKDAAMTAASYGQLVENYPPENLAAMLNVISTHDVPRVLTVLDVEQEPQRAQKRLQLLSLWQFTLPGVPCIYYGDEAGMSGGTDPDNRRTFPWGKENLFLQDWYRQLSHLRQRYAALSTGRYIPLLARGAILVYARVIEGGKDLFGEPAVDAVFIIALNSSKATEQVTVDTEGFAYGIMDNVLDPVSGPVTAVQGMLNLTLKPLSGTILQVREPQKMRRAGLLLHPTSLPGQDQDGPLGKTAQVWLDFLSAAGQKIWQILPLNPPGLGSSPYMSSSAFAGNAGLISLEALRQCGWLKDEGREKLTGATTAESRLSYLCQALRTGVLQVPEKEFAQFLQQQKYWLPDYALFRSLEKHFKEKAWTEWPEDLRTRKSEALAYWREKLAELVREEAILQFCFFKQWQLVHAYAAAKGIEILGDMPLFVAPQSADVWAHQEIFLLDPEGNPSLRAGVPPDYFAKDGQLWGNPLYNWQACAWENYQWWIERCRTLSLLVDAVRLDHFRGFVACWGVAPASTTAREGKWYEGPGAALLVQVQQAVPTLKFVAEDLGIITDAVAVLRTKLALPGMKVLPFHLREHSDGELSLETEPDSLLYTGTHDNNTLVGWLEQEVPAFLRQRLCHLTGLPADATVTQLAVGLIAYVYGRQAATVILPVQDILFLPAGSRMNTPGTVSETNWHWQLPSGVLTSAKAVWLHDLCVKYKR